MIPTGFHSAFSGRQRRRRNKYFDDGATGVLARLVERHARVSSGVFSPSPPRPPTLLDSPASQAGFFSQVLDFGSRRASPVVRTILFAARPSPRSCASLPHQSDAAARQVAWPRPPQRLSQAQTSHNLDTS